MLYGNGLFVGNKRRRGRFSFTTMANYLIKIKVYYPYPIEEEYRKVCSSFSVAISRSIKDFRKEHPKRKFKEIIVRAIRL